MVLVVAISNLAPKPASAGLLKPDDVQVTALGRQVYATHCAACHGAKLEGQPDWRQRDAQGRLPAPPHDASGHTWHHPDAVLIEIVTYGFTSGRNAPPGYASDMPGFKGVLSDEAIRASLAFIKSTWPEPVRAQQARVTREATARR
ncbi:MAG TPA: hypothetical protein DHV85_08980 [Candidatus Accumulibacter sp.]|nr:hypothetical protein [Accumulibacter sp.]